MEREPDIEIGTEAAGAPVRVDLRELAAIFAGGFLGAIARGALEQSLGVAPGSWPWATFTVNMLASGLLGYAIAWLSEHHPRTLYARAFVATGLCGALSTFSTVMIELVHLDEQAGLALAVGYGAASIAGGLVAVLLGIRLGGQGRGA